jgi:hypothetical protein
MEVGDSISIKLCDADEIAKLEVIHYGSPVYKPGRFKKVKNDGWVKPIGGLWTSPVDSNWGWKDWCKYEDFRECNDDNSFRLKFIEGSKILIIDSLDDLIKLPKYKCEYGREYPDFEFISKIFDGILLTEKGQNETRYSRPLSLYGWDCESILILNKKCCYEIRS